MPSSVPNIAIVGCGAIARAFYLPALLRLRSHFGDIWLVDPSAHARLAANAIMPGTCVSRLADIAQPIQAVIVATPNAFHFSVALEALSRDAHVLIEKPFVIWLNEGRQLIEAASSGNRVIAINQTRRTFPVTNELRQRIGSGEFGRLTGVIHHEGTKLDWPFESGLGFSRDAKRTGVIMDFGVHVIDFYEYLLNPEWSFVAGTHDGFDGPEGLAELQLLADGAPVSLRLSRYLTQENIAHLAFERADVLCHVYSDDEYTVRWKDGRTVRHRAVRKDSAAGTNAEALLLNFLAGCDKGERLYCDATSSLPVISILDTIYRESTLYPSAPGAV